MPGIIRGRQFQGKRLRVEATAAKHVAARNRQLPASDMRGPVGSGAAATCKELQESDDWTFDRHPWRTGR